MRAPNSPLAITLCLSFVALACGPKASTTAAEPAHSGPPVADEPVPETPATEEEAPPSKCFADGGTCVFEKATLECKRFEEGPEWGCSDEHTGCCFQ